ncbi:MULTISPECIES: hypothetical protein [Pseudomonas]|uniref:hypothetical protein n=1 Tax=Pseudomonas TaxID=286 RepID=UPI0018CB2B5D|nr:hypothetical protein [Pseudomonas qingdaonensis]MBG8559165.1 hypothetical protein [Pseudomonas qingdaonensis]
MDTNKMREQFEEFMRRKPKRMRGAYLRAFEAGWKSSREAVVVELPGAEGYGFSEDAAQAMRDECANAIEAQGLKVAP